MKKLRPVIKCHGGKNFLKWWLLSFFPLNYEQFPYYETHGGAGNIILNKKPGTKDVYNELDVGLFNIFWCLKNCTKEFISKVKEISYTEEVFLEHQYKPTIRYNLNSAISELIQRRMSRGGLGENFSWSERLRGGEPGDAHAWNTFKIELVHIAERLKNIDVMNCDGTDLIKSIKDSSDIIYCDPPYLHSTRVARQTYEVEMSEQDHINLAKTLLASPCRVLLSGYDNELYQDFFKDWRCEKQLIVNHSGQNKKKQMRQECLWLNF